MLSAKQSETEDAPVEHYCTLFDSHFLPSGLALLESLERHAKDFHLWVLCMDKVVEDALVRLGSANVSVIPLSDVETSELLAVKKDRTIAEYCWTWTPYIFSVVFQRATSADRVTYLDADLFFFDTPEKLFAELEESGKGVLITRHTFDPRYDTASLHGEFCVQFLIFNRSQGAQNVLRWWQNRCLEWCYALPEPSRFGDQKYLDCWPERFGDVVHVLQRTDRTLAPWNVKLFSRLSPSRKVAPVFFHFHGFRIISSERALLYVNYYVGPTGDEIYDEYLIAIRRAIKSVQELGAPLSPLPMARGTPQWWQYVRQRLMGEIRFASLTGR